MSEASSRADAFVSAHRDEAGALGRRLAEHIEDPDTFLDILRSGLIGLADPAFTVMAQRVSSEADNAYVVRGDPRPIKLHAFHTNPQVCFRYDAVLGEST